MTNPYRLYDAYLHIISDNPRLLTDLGLSSARRMVLSEAREELKYSPNKDIGNVYELLGRIDAARASLPVRPMKHTANSFFKALNRTTRNQYLGIIKRHKPHYVHGWSPGYLPGK
jgi:hypothetical protein